MGYNDVTYISIEDLKELTNISHNLDINAVVPYIKIAQRQFVFPVLGQALDEELKSAITGNTLTADQENLIQHYIKPLAAWSAFLQVTGIGSVQVTSKGLVKKNSENSTSLSVDEAAFYRTMIKDNQKTASDDLRDYLEANKALFPNYRSDCSGGSGLSTSIYLGRF